VLYRIIKKIYILTILIFLYYSGNYAKTLDLNEIIQLSFQKNSEIQKLEKELIIQKLQKNQLFFNLFYPSLNFGGNTIFQFYTNENIVKVQQGSEEIEITNYYNDNYSLNIRLNRTLFSGFKNYNDYKIKELLCKIKEKELQVKKLEIKFNIISSYFKIILLNQNIKLLKFQLEIVSNQLEEEREKFRLKRITLIDFNKTNLYYQQIYLKYLNSINDYEKEKLNLFKIIGIDEEIEFDANENIENIEYYIKVVTNLNINDISSLAISNDINIITYNYNLEIEQFNKSTLEWSRFPSISMGLDYKYNYEKDPIHINTRNWRGNWSLSFAFSLPLDSIFPNSIIESQIKQSEENIKITKIEIENYKKSIINTVKNYFLDLNYNKKSLEIQKINLNLMEENLNLAKKELELNRITTNDYFKSESDYLQAKFDYNSALYNYWIIMGKISKIIGGNL